MTARVFTWDWRQQPPMEDIAGVIVCDRIETRLIERTIAQAEQHLREHAEEASR